MFTSLFTNQSEIRVGYRSDHLYCVSNLPVNIVMEVHADTVMDMGWMRLDRSECNVGETVGVYWSFPNYSYMANSEDWIGLFKVGKCI